MKKLLDYFTRQFNSIPDKKAMAYMGAFCFTVGFLLSVMWYRQGEEYWWVAFVFFMAFYGFAWFMAWVLRNNP